MTRLRNLKNGSLGLTEQTVLSDQWQIISHRGVVAANLAFRTLVLFEQGNDSDVQAATFAALANFAEMVAPDLVAMQLPGDP